MTEEQYDIFISFHHNQMDELDAFLRGIRKGSYRCWANNKQSIHGIDICFKAMIDANIFLYFLSKDFAKSIKCRSEISFAIEQRKNVIFFIFDDFDASQYVEKFPEDTKIFHIDGSIKYWDDHQFENFEKTVEEIFKNHSIPLNNPTDHFKQTN